MSVILRLLPIPDWHVALYPDLHFLHDTIYAEYAHNTQFVTSAWFSSVKHAFVPKLLRSLPAERFLAVVSIVDKFAAAILPIADEIGLARVSEVSLGAPYHLVLQTNVSCDRNFYSQAIIIWRRKKWCAVQCVHCSK